MQASFPADLLSILRTRTAEIARQFTNRRLAPDGSDILGAVYIEVATLAKNDPAILTDAARFRAVVEKRIQWECFKFLRSSPWGDPWANANKLEER